MSGTLKQINQIDRFIELQSYRYIKQTIQSPHFEFIEALEILFGWRVPDLWSNIQLFLWEPLCIAWKVVIVGIVSSKQVILLREVFHLSIYSVDSLRRNYLIYCPCDSMPCSVQSFELEYILVMQGRRSIWSCDSNF